MRGLWVRGVLLLCCVGVWVGVVGGGVVWGVGSAGWLVRGVGQPSRFVAGGFGRYQVLVEDVGGEVGEAPVFRDVLPRGVGFLGVTGEGWGCSSEEVGGQVVVSCVLESGEAVGVGGYAPVMFVDVSVAGGVSGVLRNVMSVSGGGAGVVGETVQETVVGGGVPGFGVEGFQVQASGVDGGGVLQGGGHPWMLTTSFGVPWTQAPGGALSQFVPVENLKKVSVELPLGMVGDPFAAERCDQSALKASSLSGCPAGSQVGTIAIAAGIVTNSEFLYSNGPGGEASGLFDMKTEPGYPAEFAFTFDRQTFYLYATVVHSVVGDRLRLTTIGAPPLAESGDVVVTVWGEPGQVPLNGSGSEEALIDDPARCGVPGMARIELEPWAHPGHVVSAETQVFAGLTGCGLLSGFVPGLSFGVVGEAATRRVDSPSGFGGELVLPQSTGFASTVVSQVRDASVVLPAGVTINPGSAHGLVGCAARGPEGINLGSSSIGANGRDEGDPEATELGEGHAGGNGSPYNDDLYHTAPGHCPAASTIASVEVISPLVPRPLTGHVFIAQPRCGGPGLAGCVEGDAETGVLFTGYIEVAGDGVIVKEPGVLSVNPATGRVTLRVKDLPQLPFSSLKLTAKAGQDAALATPQSCGVIQASSTITPWEGEPVFAASTPFGIEAINGGACPAVAALTPGFTAGSISTEGGAHTSFTSTLTRHDGEQNITGLSVTPPVGLLALLANVTPCPEPQASTGQCPYSSAIGQDTVSVGSGSDPFYASGNVYLTGPYNGAPFGLSVVTPAVAGPFSLGNVVVRAAITVNPTTAVATITSAAIPQIKDGIPLRLKTLNVTIDREQFIINPTNCSQQQVTATISGSQTSSSLTVPFAATACDKLPFNPHITASTPGQASKHNGAGLTVSLTATPGNANIEKVKVDLPKQLPSRLSTLQKACPDTLFSTNPAACPPASNVGHATLHTPILKTPMTGPIYLVSHGGSAFPDLVIVLQAEGITINLAGNTNIKHGITSETFKTIPDAPFNTFQANFPQGPTSILATNLPPKTKNNLCTQNLHLNTSITAQNNLNTTTTTHITPTNCPKHHTTHKHTHHTHTKH
jgi:hypothetical protein